MVKALALSIIIALAAISGAAKPVNMVHETRAAIARVSA